MATPAWLPRHDAIGGARRAYEAAALLTALALLAGHGLRLAAAPGSPWPWLPLALVAGAAAADLASGLVHWLADSWGRESMPILGRRLPRPFRVHHVNPADFLRRDWLDTNGDVAALVALVLAPALALPLDTATGRIAAAFLTAFGAAALPTNQVHQWAHMPRPPRAVRWLQDRGLLLGRAAHAQHHRAPHTRPLTASQATPDPGVAPLPCRSP